MKIEIRPVVTLLFVCASLAAAPLPAQVNLSKYVALGDSYGAGFSAGCLVDRNQRFSYPNTLARQFGIGEPDEILVVCGNQLAFVGIHELHLKPGAGR